MAIDLRHLDRLLSSPNKAVRLKALKLILRHPDASPLQIVRCLCSEDNRNFEFQNEFDLGHAMRASWPRLRGVRDDEVYDSLESLYKSDPDAHRQLVVHVLELLATRRALDMLVKIRDATAGPKRLLIDQAVSRLSQNIAEGQ